MKEPKDVYDLVGHDGTALIVRESTGMAFDAQTGGVSCNHPSCEGFVISLPRDIVDYDDCPLGCWGGGSLENRIKLADELDSNFASRPSVFNFKVDRRRINELEEGWWPVTFDLFGASRTGYIHNGNCD